VYSAANQLLEIHKISSVEDRTTGRSNFRVHYKVKFYYPSATDTVANKLEGYKLGNNEKDLILDDELTITTNSVENPIYKNLWFCNFITFMTANDFSISTPMLYDHPSSDVQWYLVFVPKCVTNYKVKNSWGASNYTNSNFSWTYSSDSLKLTTNNGKTLGQTVFYNFKKIKK
jgi:hypothetical protein